MSSSVRPAFASTLWTASMGAVVNSIGAWLCCAEATMRAIGVLPFADAHASDATTSAAAPSLMELALAAVTVPSLVKTARSVGILSKLVLAGSSSCSTTVSPRRPGTVTGTISWAKAPFSTEAWARV